MNNSPNRGPSDPVPEMPPHIALRYLQAKTHPSDYEGISVRVKAAGLREVAAAYEANVGRLHSLIDLPAGLVFVSKTVQFHGDRALLQVQGHLNGPTLTPEETSSHTTLLLQYLNEWASKVDDELYRQNFVRIGMGGLPFVVGNFNDALLPGLEAILIAQITGVWTAFESLTGDLWEAALNAHPKRLAALCGSSGRIKKIAKRGAKGQQESGGEHPTPTPMSGAESDDKTVRLSDIHKLTRGDCNLSGKMGSLIRESERFSFSTPDGIRAAYSTAFDKQTAAIDALLADRSIDALCVVRNVFVHRGGKADERYNRGAQGTDAPKVEPGTKIPINGKLVGDLIGPVMTIGVKLIESVDQWLTNNLGDGHDE